jgi:hypothetical protein
MRQPLFLSLLFLLNRISFIITYNANNVTKISIDNYTSSNNDMIRFPIDGINVWKDKDTYYYKQIQLKMKNLVIHGNCTSNFIQIVDNIIETPELRDEVFISIFPINKSIQLYWKNMIIPKQHRVDPFICEVVYQRKKLPIFNNTR